MLGDGCWVMVRDWEDWGVILIFLEVEWMD